MDITKKLFLPKDLKLYHATFQSFLPSIEEKGLLPGQKQNWEGCVSGFVYLADDPDCAISFCETAEDTAKEDYDSGICCFEVDLDSLNQDLLTYDPNILDAAEEFSRCYAYAGSIPFHSLRMYWREEVEPSSHSLADKIQSASIRSEGLALSKAKEKICSMNINFNSGKDGF